MDEYTCTVTFKRSLAEDTETARLRYPDLPLKEALQRQLKDEIQSACDEGCIVGFFNVDAVHLHESLTSEAPGQ